MPLGIVVIFASTIACLMDLFDGWMTQERHSVCISSVAIFLMVFPALICIGVELLIIDKRDIASENGSNAIFNCRMRPSLKTKMKCCSECFLLHLLWHVLGNFRGLIFICKEPPTVFFYQSWWLTHALFIICLNNYLLPNGFSFSYYPNLIPSNHYVVIQVFYWRTCT